MPWISSFLAGYRTGPLHRLLKNEISGHHGYILQNMQLEIINWFHTSAFIRPKAHSLNTYQMPTLFSKEPVISGSHPDNLVCGFNLPKNDLDCPGYLTHFQPWSDPACLQLSTVFPHLT